MPERVVLQEGNNILDNSKTDLFLKGSLYVIDDEYFSWPVSRFQSQAQLFPRACSVRGRIFSIINHKGFRRGLWTPWTWNGRANTS